MFRRLVPLLLAVALLPGCVAGRTAESSSDSVFSVAFRDGQSGIQVTGTGAVIRTLPDDNTGGRHQRFIVELASGQTLLIAHNIDIAPRIDTLAVGDGVKFHGQYEWNGEGGVVHWTHHDPDGTHEPGWIDHNGLRYQ
ncbi:MAG: DUF3465 domain-containing protein [Coriobacteriia bacterium]|nr:DUF3465 domain-containing protein [Coriobacteriia bacterium]